MFKPLTDYDFRIYSNDRASHLSFYLEEYIHERLPSISCTIEIKDYKFNGWNSNVWFEFNDVMSCITQLEQMEEKRQGKVSLSAMSPEDFNITLEIYNKKGDLVLNYSISNIKYNTETKIRRTLTGGFSIDPEFFLKLLADLKRFISVAKLETNIDFR
jgi:hypothetical protein